MERVSFGILRDRAVEALKQGKAAVVFVRTNDWFDFAARAVQIKGYFCHVEWLDYIDEQSGEIRTINANGKKVVWDSFERYKGACLSGKKEMTLGIVNCSHEEKLQMSVEMRSQVGHDYDDGQNRFEAITEIMSWFGGMWKAASGHLDKINPMGDPNKFNCSESCARGIRAPKDGSVSKYNVCKDFDVQAITPTDLANDGIVKKDYQTIKTA